MTRSMAKKKTTGMVMRKDSSLDLMSQKTRPSSRNPEQMRMVLPIRDKKRIERINEKKKHLLERNIRSHITNTHKLNMNGLD